jgi:uncharacterized protein (TIGR02118 family)
MIKLVYCLRRKPEISPEEFRRYWLDQHAAIIKKHAKTLNLKRYVQTHPTPSALMDAFNKSREEPPYDGIAEIWYDSVDDIKTASATPEGKAAAREIWTDEAKFIEGRTSPVMISVEHEIFG